MGCGSFLKSPKEEEREVPDCFVTPLSNIEEEACADVEVVNVDDLEGVLGVDDEENMSCENVYDQFSLDLMDWDEQAGEEGEYKVDNLSNFFDEGHCSGMVIKKESFDFWDDYEQCTTMSLNLNLNYQEVMDAWSDRGHLLTNDCSLSMASSGNYMGEVPVMEEEKARREASVLRYKEKRQTRLFSKKIRYQVRKLNADKRPRLKGRFVKRCS